jgi:ribosomal-protein-alanine N-acetyltransferase
MNRFAWGERLPTIGTERLELRALSESDVPDLFAVFSDPNVMKYRDGLLMTTAADAAAYLAQIDQGFRSRELFEWGISNRTTGAIVGTCTLLNLSTIHSRGEIGFALGKPYWGQGLATEAVKALISFAFVKLDLRRLEADVDPRNVRSLTLLERLGFQREGYLRERYHVNGEVQDAIALGLLRHEWEAMEPEIA